jgi:signal transduction histidine kinase
MKKEAALEDMVDLGLFTRILCHEMNNLLASQQGFLKLLGRGAPDPETLARWNNEVLLANQELQNLVRSVQSYVHTEFPKQDLNSPPREAHLMKLADEAIQLNALIPKVALSRLLVITEIQLNDIKAENSEWVLTYETGPMVNCLLEHGSSPQKFLSLGTTLHPNMDLSSELNSAANRILPPRDSAHRDWNWALVIGLLRQSQGDMRLSAAADTIDSSCLKLEILLPLQ